MSVFEKRSHRKPPKPLSWNLPRGNCRFCGAVIFKEDGSINTRRNWHEPCITEWMICNNPSHARAWAWEHFKGVCQGCGKSSWAYGDKWEVDHDKPLFLAEGDLSYWAKENLVLYCQPCHVHKTQTIDLPLYRKLKGLL